MEGGVNTRIRQKCVSLVVYITHSSRPHLSPLLIPSRQQLPLTRFQVFSFTNIATLASDTCREVSFSSTPQKLEMARLTAFLVAALLAVSVTAYPPSSQHASNASQVQTTVISLHHAPTLKVFCTVAGEFSNLIRFNGDKINDSSFLYTAAQGTRQQVSLITTHTNGGSAPWPVMSTESGSPQGQYVTHFAISHSEPTCVERSISMTNAPLSHIRPPLRVVRSKL